MLLSLLVFVSMFLAATADQTGNEIDSDNIVLASSLVDSDTTRNNEIGAVDTSSVISFNSEAADSNDDGDFSIADDCDNAPSSEALLESDTAFGQAFGDSSVKSRRDAACHIRDQNSEFILPGDKPAQGEKLGPPVPHRITNVRNPVPPMWAKNCVNHYTYALCCKGEIRRTEKRHVQSKVNVEECIWGQFYFLFSLRFVFSLTLTILIHGY